LDVEFDSLLDGMQSLSCQSHSTSTLSVISGQWFFIRTLLMQRRIATKWEYSCSGLICKPVNFGQFKKFVGQLYTTTNR
jgi:hypothetical protein